jgi:NAD(P)-dependent dehydrogenase (short-subunit alcohol dehydrogenase family)
VADKRLRGRVAIVTGAGGGIGKAHALALARHGARVVVNDFGGSMEGSGSSAGPAQAVASEIIANGGDAIADTGDVGSWKDAEALIRTAIERFGDLDILVNNAGILRPRTLVGMTEEDATSVIRVHLIGTMATTHFAAAHWRARFKAKGTRGGRLINTTSPSGLFAAGQANYDAAKAGIAALTIVAARELAPYGVAANAIGPIALTRMSEGIAPTHFTADHAAELACWLASDAAQLVSGHVFIVGGGVIAAVDRWHTGQSIARDAIWDADALDAAMPDLLARATRPPDALGFYESESLPAQLAALNLPRHDKGAAPTGTKT